MKFFENRSINFIYAHSALHGLSEQIGGIFVFVFLLKAGIPAHFVLLSFAAIVLCRLVFRQIAIPFANRFGLRQAFIFGVVVGAIAYIPLGFVHGLSPMLAVFLLIHALGDAFYWSCYHATTARLGDQESRGAQVSAVQLIYASSAIIGPLIGSSTQVYLGSVFAFMLAACVRLLSAVPLLQIMNSTSIPTGVVDTKAKRFAWRIYFFDGVTTAGINLTWTMALFITLNQNFQTYGLALSGAAVIGAIMGLGIGRLVDLGHHRWSVAIGMGVISLFAVAAALGYRDPFTAIIALAVSAVAGPLYASAFNARVYNVAQKSGDALRFHVVGEGGWDLGCALGCCAAALMVWRGFDYGWPIGIGIIGVAGVSTVLYRSYQNDDPSLR
jgi:MFS transporter, DHA1 family, inner membrane transport protein